MDFMEFPEDIRKIVKTNQNGSILIDDRNELDELNDEHY